MELGSGNKDETPLFSRLIIMPDLQVVEQFSGTRHLPAASSPSMVAYNAASCLSAHIQVSPCQGWAVCAVRELRIRQCTRIADGGRAKASTTSPPSTIPLSTPLDPKQAVLPEMDATPVSVECIDVRCRLGMETGTGPSSSPLIRVKAQTPQLHVEADTALLLLGSAHYYCSLAAQMATSASALLVQSTTRCQGGATPAECTPPDSPTLSTQRKGRQSLLEPVVELSATCLEIGCSIGEKDQVSLQVDHGHYIYCNSTTALAIFTTRLLALTVIGTVSRLNQLHVVTSSMRPPLMGCCSAATESGCLRRGSCLY